MMDNKPHGRYFIVSCFFLLILATIAIGFFYKTDYSQTILTVTLRTIILFVLGFWHVLFFPFSKAAKIIAVILPWMLMAFWVITPACQKVEILASRFILSDPLLQGKILLSW